MVKKIAFLKDFINKLLFWFEFHAYNRFYF